jgi:hypothetical protein
VVAPDQVVAGNGAGDEASGGGTTGYDGKGGAARPRPKRGVRGGAGAYSAAHEGPRVIGSAGGSRERRRSPEMPKTGAARSAQCGGLRLERVVGEEAEDVGGAVEPVKVARETRWPSWWSQAATAFGTEEKGASAREGEGGRGMARRPGEMDEGALIPSPQLLRRRGGQWPERGALGHGGHDSEAGQVGEQEVGSASATVASGPSAQEFFPFFFSVKRKYPLLAFYFGTK